MRVVVTHPQMGLFLGLNRERTWWTGEVLQAAIPEAITFPDAEQALMFCATHFPEYVDACQFTPVETGNTIYASIKSLVAAGLSDHCKKLLYYTSPQGNA